MSCGMKTGGFDAPSTRPDHVLDWFTWSLMLQGRTNNVSSSPRTHDVELETRRRGRAGRRTRTGP